ncbi:hypothetical protein AMECASPLE_011416 [Ameca splendens]|uniref:Secreted protein n=1 Tax=Ameca splendens TaxID=208324 RepID=A0ABV0XDV7_9TELE
MSMLCLCLAWKLCYVFALSNLQSSYGAGVLRLFYLNLRITLVDARLRSQHCLLFWIFDFWRKISQALPEKLLCRTLRLRIPQPSRWLDYSNIVSLIS